MNWTVDEPWHDKLNRLVSTIDRHVKAGKTLSLIGESAGASAVINALGIRSRSLRTVILLCGKTQYPDRVAAYRYRQNPALRQALIASSHIINQLTNEQKEKLLNLHPILDPVVPVSETKIPNVKNSVMPTFGHALSIVFANTIWSWWIVRFIRHRS